MVSIRSGEGQDILFVVRAHIANQRTQASPQPSNGSSNTTISCR
jgi:hypothetical protein